MTLALFCMRYFRTILNVALTLRTWELKWGPISKSIRLQDLGLVFTSRNDELEGDSAHLGRLFELERPALYHPLQPLLGTNEKTSPINAQIHPATQFWSQGSRFSDQWCFQLTKPNAGIGRTGGTRSSFKEDSIPQLYKPSVPFVANMYITKTSKILVSNKPCHNYKIVTSILTYSISGFFCCAYVFTERQSSSTYSFAW